jgi:hypothetical protein
MQVVKILTSSSSVRLGAFHREKMLFSKPASIKAIQETDYPLDLGIPDAFR